MTLNDSRLVYEVLNFVGVPLEQEHRLSSLFTQSVAGKSEMTQGLSMFLVHLQNAFEGIQQPNAVIDDVLFEVV